MDVAQDLPLRQCLVKLPTVLIIAGLGDNRVHQVAFLPRQPKRLFEVRFARKRLQRLLEDIDPPLDIRLGFHAAVDFRYARR